MFELPPAPRLTGPVLRSVVAATAAEPVRRAASMLMRKELGMEAVARAPGGAEAGPAPRLKPLRARDRHLRASDELPPPSSSSILPSATAWQARFATRAPRRAPCASAPSPRPGGWPAPRPTMAVLCDARRRRRVRDAQASAVRWKLRRAPRPARRRRGADQGRGRHRGDRLSPRHRLRARARRRSSGRHRGPSAPRRRRDRARPQRR